jgi:tetratricopeptide (TPR) repeat protein
MAGRKLFTVLLIVSCLPGFSTRGGELFGSSRQDKRELAIQWYNEGKFKDALPLFSKLCYDLPYDFTIKYFYGACLVETGNFGLDAEKNLVLASSGEVSVKVYYYLGRLYHGRGNWNNAQRFYNRFRNNADNQAIAETKVDDLMELCFKEINPFVSEKADSLFSSVPADVGVSVVQPVPVNPAVVKDIPVAKVVNDQDVQEKPDPVKFIDFQINDKVTYLVEDMFHEAEAKTEFRIAVNKESQLDSLLKVVQMLRKQYHLNVNPLIRDSLAIRIQNLEYRNLVLNTEVDQHYFKSRMLEQEWWSKTAYSSLEEYNSWKDSLEQIRDTHNLPEIVQVEEQIPDSVTVHVMADSTAVASETKPDTDIVYKIQIGAYNKGIPTQRKLQFERLEKIRTIETLSLEDGITVFTTGNLKNIEDALKLQTQIRLEGIKDAFVIGVRNGKKVTLPKEITK